MLVFFYSKRPLTTNKNKNSNQHRPPHSDKMSNAWPENCTRGDAEQIQKQFHHLAKLGIPLGTTESDANARCDVLQSLLAFDESIMDTKKHKLSTKFNQVHYVLKIPRIQASTKPDVAVRTLKRRQFFELLFECMHENDNADKTAAIFCNYLAKYHNAAFVEAIPVAQSLHANNRGNMHASTSAREDIIMYDGGSRKNTLHVTWNHHYRDILAYKELHGHCSLPPGGTKGLSEHDRELSNWVAWQRRQYKDKAPSLTPKRIQLLEAVGITWSSTKPRVDCANDPKFHKAVAAKIFFDSTTLTARDAMTMAGYEKDVACTTTRKNHVNQMASNFYKKEFKHSGAVREILTALGKMFHPHADRYAIIQSAFGPSAALSTLQQDGKLKPSKEAQERPLMPQAGQGQSGESTRISESLDTVHVTAVKPAVGTAVPATGNESKKRKLSSVQFLEERSEAEGSRG
jgi:Helicase associated domain